MDREEGQSNLKLVKSRLMETGQLNKRAASNYLKKYSFNEIFQAKFPTYYRELVQFPEQVTEMLEDLQTLCETFSPEKQNSFVLGLKKSCELLFSKDEKRMLNQKISQQYPLKEQKNEQMEKLGAYKLFELLCFIFSVEFPE